MTDALFDLDLEPAPQLHGCTGQGCAWCAWRDGPLAKAAGMTAVHKDLEWQARADAWLNELYVGVIITADDLIAECGLPVGSSNQVGARFFRWAKANRVRHVGYAKATRKLSHSRVIRTWQVTA